MGMGRPPGQRDYDFDGQAALQRRHELGLSQVDVAVLCKQLAGVEVHDSNLSKYERGVGCPSPEALDAIATALDVEVGDITTPREKDPVAA
jgi:transcriptional regulator with XRE-family HTH domain